ncbi:MAG: molybdate ABC transporter substrate-binding protein [Akkermansiaceae bacterium]|nr:molybdate ABC transporter substrate-binding protein [Akkermansiaceae bacterium]
MKKPFYILGLLLVTLGVLVFILSRHGKPVESSAEVLTVHCAAALQKPVREIARQYEMEYGTRIRLNFAGSGVLASQIKVSGGDLYIPADSSYIGPMKAEGLVLESTDLARLRAVVVVRKGNPRNIRSMDDLARRGVRISVGEPTAAIGSFVRRVLMESGDWERISPQILVTKPTVNNVVEDVATGAVDAGLAWDAVASQFKDVELVRVPVFEDIPRCATAGILRGAEVPAALHFMRYLAATGRGRDVFEKMGFTVPAVADSWTDAPVLTLFAGSMLRPAIEDRLRLFEQREGCRIKTVFDGCGTLLARMNENDAGAMPSAYFPCDSTFLSDVKDRFGPGMIITSNEIVMLVPKGNPRGLKKLDDLSKIGLRVGLADAGKSALGKLTMDMMMRYGCWDELHDSGNVVVLASKGEELANQMQSGALDAALIYLSNAMASPGMMADCKIIRLRQPDAIAHQPFVVAHDTPYPQMVLRLRDFITHDDARSRFEQLGFKFIKREWTDE